MGIDVPWVKSESAPRFFFLLRSEYIDNSDSMKYLVILSTCLLFSCSKSWDCTITYTTEVNPLCTTISSSSYEQTFEFNGTKKEMKAYTDDVPEPVCAGTPDCDYCVITTFDCVKK